MQDKDVKRSIKDADPHPSRRAPASAPPKGQMAFELTEGMQAQGLFLLQSLQLKTTRNGDPYLCLRLIDRSGQLDGRLWSQAKSWDAQLMEGDLLQVQGEMVRFGQQLQLKLASIEPLSPEAAAAVDLREFLPSSRWKPQALFAQLEQLVCQEIESEAMQRFLQALFAQESIVERLQQAPAASRNHHQYLGGLLEHTLSMARIARDLSQHYRRYYPGLINADLVLAGCVLHDLGKIDELVYQRQIGYSTEGRLIGHIVRGVELVNEVVQTMQPAPPADMVTQLKHLILSHHGRLEYGSPSKPQTPEALLLHEIDMIDSRMNMCWQAMEASRPQGAERAEGWTSYQPLFESRLYWGDAQKETRWASAPRGEELIGPGQASRQTTPRRECEAPIDKAPEQDTLLCEELKVRQVARSARRRPSARGKKRVLQSSDDAHNTQQSLTLDLFGGETL